MNYLIRKAKVSDIKELSILKRNIWETTYRGIYSDDKIDNYSYSDNEKKFLNIISNKNIDFFVVVDKEKIVGYMTCGEPIRKYMDYEQEIGLLYLVKDYQGIGIGRKLFELAYNIIKNKGYNRFFISCNKFNIDAQLFYIKMGGKCIEIDEDYEDKSYSQVKFHYDIV